MSDLNSFLTGSQVYGIPTENSDIDMVVLVTESDREILKNNSELSNKIIFGKLNLILLSKEVPEEVVRFHLWKQGTEDLIARRPVTRQYAIDYLDSIGLDDDYDY